MAAPGNSQSKEKKQTQTLQCKKCCMFSHLCKTKEEDLHVCCSFCKKTDCDIRCCDDPNECKYITTPEECIKFSFTRGEVDMKEYAKYNKIYPHNKKDLALIKEYRDEKENSKKPRGRKPKKEQVAEEKIIVVQEPVKRGRGRPPKVIVKQEEVTPQPVKRGRGRPPKNKEGENK